MNKSDKLKTFQFVKNGKVISPVLTTTREYGRWMIINFDSYTCQVELEMHCGKSGIECKGGMEWHPGTKIGDYFKRNEKNFYDRDYFSWYFIKDSHVFSKVNAMGLCEGIDSIPYSVSYPQKRYMIRCYTMKQLDVYLKTNVMRDFYIADKYLDPRNIFLKDKDLADMIIPEGRRSVKSLLFRKEAATESLLV